MKSAKVGAIHVSGDSATGEFKIGDRVAPPPYAWRFKREDGVWRFSLLPLMRMSEPAIQEMVKKSGLDETAFVLSMLENVSGEPVAAGIWEPLRVP